MSKELEEQKAELESQIADINSALEREEAIKEVIRLSEITDILNALHQDSILEKHCEDEASMLYSIMEKVDSATQDIMSEQDIEEDDIYNAQ